MSRRFMQIEKLFPITSMHSSRMRTDRLLTICLLAGSADTGGDVVNLGGGYIHGGCTWGCIRGDQGSCIQGAALEGCIQGVHPKEGCIQILDALSTCEQNETRL